jgi:hypothetical protein
MGEVSGSRVAAIGAALEELSAGSGQPNPFALLNGHVILYQKSEVLSMGLP